MMKALQGTAKIYIDMAAVSILPYIIQLDIINIVRACLLRKSSMTHACHYLQYYINEAAYEPETIAFDY